MSKLAVLISVDNLAAARVSGLCFPSAHSRDDNEAFFLPFPRIELRVKGQP
jgi:hypothetical protein